MASSKNILPTADDAEQSGSRQNGSCSRIKATSSDDAAAETARSVLDNGGLASWSSADVHQAGRVWRVDDGPGQDMMTISSHVATAGWTVELSCELRRRPLDVHVADAAATETTTPMLTASVLRRPVPAVSRWVMNAASTAGLLLQQLAPAAAAAAAVSTAAQHCWDVVTRQRHSQPMLLCVHCKRWLIVHSSVFLSQPDS